MELFRITKSQYADQLLASGIAGRWNRSGEEVIYAAGSRSLACLENLFHRNGRGTTQTFITMVIYVPDHVPLRQINTADLPLDWNQSAFCKACQELGSAWYREEKHLILKVPSAVIPDEHNFVINTLHPDFEKVQLVYRLPFGFDQKLEE